MYGLASHLTHNRSFRRQVFPGNQLHWYCNVPIIIATHMSTATTSTVILTSSHMTDTDRYRYIAQITKTNIHIGLSHVTAVHIHYQITRRDNRPQSIILNSSLSSTVTIALHFLLEMLIFLDLKKTNWGRNSVQISARLLSLLLACQ